MLFLFALVPYLPLKNAEHTILAMIRLIAPTQGLYKSISSVIVDFMHTEQRKVLSFGILLTLYFSSNGIMGLMRSFDNSEHVYVRRSDLKRRWVAIKLTFLLYGVVILAMLAFIVQTQWVNKIIQKIFVSVLLGKLLTILLVIFIVLCAISVIYSYGPSISHKFRFISPGSVLATILLVLATVGFYYMANNFLNYNKVYGSIGTLIAFMVWIWLNTMVILIGFELNVSIVLGKISRAKNESAKKKI
jgi:membrane protein